MNEGERMEEEPSCQESKMMKSHFGCPPSWRIVFVVDRSGKYMWKPAGLLCEQGDINPLVSLELHMSTP
jgi:hypothetical protein